MQGTFWAAFGVRFPNSASAIDSLLNRSAYVAFCFYCLACMLPLFYLSCFEHDLFCRTRSFTLEELLDESEVIQECKFGNSLLVDYLARPDILEKLVKYCIMIPSNPEPLFSSLNEKTNIT